jgi:hypothetical protein
VTHVLPPPPSFSNELLLLHKVFYEDLVQITQLPESAQVDKLFEVLECTFPAFGLYSSYLTSNRPQNVQVSSPVSDLYYVLIMCLGRLSTWILLRSKMFWTMDLKFGTSQICTFELAR